VHHQAGQGRPACAAGHGDVDDIRLLTTASPHHRAALACDSCPPSRAATSSGAGSAGRAWRPRQGRTSRPRWTASHNRCRVVHARTSQARAWPPSRRTTSTGSRATRARVGTRTSFEPSRRVAQCQSEAVDDGTSCGGVGTNPDRHDRRRIDRMRRHAAGAAASRGLRRATADLAGQVLDGVPAWCRPGAGMPAGCLRRRGGDAS
jgi:hypothetical protein